MEWLDVAGSCNGGQLRADRHQSRCAAQLPAAGGVSHQIQAALPVAALEPAIVPNLAIGKPASAGAGPRPPAAQPPAGSDPAQPPQGTDFSELFQIQAQDEAQGQLPDDGVQGALIPLQTGPDSVRVPEPGSLGLMLVGVLALLAQRRRAEGL